LGFGDGRRQRQVVIAAGDIASLSEQIGKVKATPVAHRLPVIRRGAVSMNDNR